MILRTEEEKDRWQDTQPSKTSELLYPIFFSFFDEPLIVNACHMQLYAYSVMLDTMIKNGWIISAGGFISDGS